MLNISAFKIETNGKTASRETTRNSLQSVPNGAQHHARHADLDPQTTVETDQRRPGCAPPDPDRWPVPAISLASTRGKTYTARVDLAQIFEHHLDLPEPAQPLDPKTLPAGRGVCALTDAEGRLILTLSAENLRRSLTHRLQPPDQDKRRLRADLRAIARRLWWKRTTSAFETSLTYLDVVRRLYPTRYREHLAFGPVWFARADPRETFPRWVADRFAFAPAVVDVGPFRDRPSCRRFIELLEDLFDLCRYHDILRQAPNGQACAYKEMGRCPAPCDGSVSMDRYRRSIGASIEFALGKSDIKLALLREAMVSAGKRLQFEKAAHIREQIAQARSILAADGRLQTTPESFRYLVIQRGGGTTRVKPFYVDRGAIRVGKPVPLKQVDSAAPDWADNMQRFWIDSADVDPVHRSEGVWLVSHFLIKGERAPGLFVHEAQLDRPDELARRVVRKLAGDG
jgi:hypothetical protein